MFSHRPFFLHQILLASTMQNCTVEAAEDFAVVGGLAGSSFLLAQADNAQCDYLIPCGVDGLPYVAELGRPGGSVDLTFGNFVQAVTIVTYSAMRPAVTVTPFYLVQGSYFNGLILPTGLSDTGVVVAANRGYDVKMSAEDSARFLDVFATGKAWKGPEGYPGFTMVAQ